MGLLAAGRRVHGLRGSRSGPGSETLARRARSAAARSSGGISHREQSPGEPAPRRPLRAPTKALSRPRYRHPAPASRSAETVASAPVLGALLAVAGTLGLLAVLDVYELEVAGRPRRGGGDHRRRDRSGALTGRRVGALVAPRPGAPRGFASPPRCRSDLRRIGERTSGPLDAEVIERSLRVGIGDYALELDGGPDHPAGDRASTSARDRGRSSSPSPTTPPS